MQWIITVDHINNREGDSPQVGKMMCPPELAAQLRAASPAERQVIRDAFKAAMTDEFRLYDDDGELYYEGLCLDLDNQDGDSAFQPLDWAMGDVGCTEMRHRKRGVGDWATL
jgi:hypothetical protein